MAHIIVPDNHPELEGCFDYVRQTIYLGHRRQDQYDPNSHFLTKNFEKKQ